MTELATVPNGAIQIGSGDADRTVRRSMVDFLQNNAPGLMDLAAKCSPTDTFRVVMSQGHAHLLHAGADGFYRTALIDHGRIVENAQLAAVGTNLVAMAPNAVMFVAMQAVAAKLSAIDAKVDVIGGMIVAGQHGRLRGAVDALATASRISDAGDRRRMMLSACSAVQVEIVATAGILQAQIGVMPEAKTGRFEGLFGTGFTKVSKLFEPVRETVAAIGHGTAALLEAFATLEESEAGRFAMKQIAESINAAGISDAVRKARLLPATGGAAPEAGLVLLAKAVEMVGTCLQGAERLTVTMDLQLKELVHV